MSKYLIDFENSHWCGGQLFVVVEAESPEEAEIKAESWMEETQRELFADEYFEAKAEECEDFDDECPYSVNSVELFTPEHEHWQCLHSLAFILRFK